MCGIAGFINKNAVIPDRMLLERMACEMALRGPDAHGVFVKDNIGFAHRRLSIIDLSGGAQPMTDSARGTTIVFNGEIFNFLELKKDLETKYSINFSSASDTEVLLKMYDVYGIGMLDFLNGFFSFAIFDEREKKVFVARDRFGVKPLFYFSSDECFAFASELAALKHIKSFPNELRMDAISDYMSLGYIPREKSVYKNVFKLMAGTYLELDFSGRILNEKRYFQISFADKLDISYRDACSELRRLMTDAVRKRLISDVPLGVFLSGGIDSAVTGAIAAKLSSGSLKCFSIGFADKRYDETSDAVINANFINNLSSNGIDHKIRTVDPCDFSVLEKLVPRFGEPFADASMIPTYLLSSFAREDVTVALSGDAADDFFAGYERYLAIKYLNIVRRIPKSLLKAASKTLPSRGERTLQGRLKRFLESGAVKTAEQYENIITHGHGRILKRIGNDALGNYTFSASELFSPTASDPVEALMEFDIETYLSGDILVKADTCSMAASLEVRSPFLDYRVAEFACSLPRHFKQSYGTRKRIIRDAFSDMISPETVRKRKRGFGVPVSAWFRNEWNTILKEHLLEDSLLHSLFRKNELENLINEHEQHKSDHGTILFYLLILELFLNDHQSPV